MNSNISTFNVMKTLCMNPRIIKVRTSAASLHNDPFPENLYVADATLLPNSLGNPPILTIIALSRRVGKLCINIFKTKETKYEIV